MMYLISPNPPLSYYSIINIPQACGKCKEISLSGFSQDKHACGSARARLAVIGAVGAGGAGARPPDKNEARDIMAVDENGLAAL